MNNKNIYLFQPIATISKSLYLPYSIGTIAAYSFEHESIKAEYCLNPFLFKKEPYEEVMEKTKNPYLVGFSCYVWNVDYNLNLAKRIKEKYPDCIVCLGGPQIPDDISYLSKYSYVDILMHGEGELTFYDLLTALAEKSSLSCVENISYRNGAEIIKNHKRENDLSSDFPSPYTNGYFDHILNDPRYKDYQFDMVLESNRGCPYSCTYCCWGGTYKSFRKFPLERVKEELLWAAKHKIFYCLCADSNFGIFERDEEITDYVIELKKKYGYPCLFETIAAKNKDERVFNINYKLEKAGLNRGISVAIQSMAPEVLNNVGRQIISSQALKSTLEKYRNHGISTYTDMILGLPGETLESFCKGIFEVIECGQHTYMIIYILELLPNTEMYKKEYIDKYKMKTVATPFSKNHALAKVVDGDTSLYECVVETSTLSRREWVTAEKVSIMALGMHCMGLLKYISIYLRKTIKLSYYDFYMGLFEFFRENDNVASRIFNQSCSTIEAFSKGEGKLSFFDERFGDIYWHLEEGLYLLAILDYDNFYESLVPYLSQYFQDEQLMRDLISFQKNIILIPKGNKTNVQFKHDWAAFFCDIFEEEKEVPNEQEVTLEFETYREYDSMFEYGKEIIWYGRRNERMIRKFKKL